MLVESAVFLLTFRELCAFVCVSNPVVSVCVFYFYISSVTVVGESD